MVEFVSGISVVCFAASYAVAFACEASRLVFRSGVRGAAMVAFAAAGLVAHTLFLAWRATHEPAVPLSSAFDWYLLAAWVLAGGSLWLTIANPRTPVGLFMLPIVLGLIGAAQVSSREPFPQSPATQIWGAVHGSFNLAASVAVAVAAIAGLMWLIQAERLGRKQAPLGGLRLPSLERLAHTTGRIPAIAAWLAVRPPASDGSNALFLSARGARVSPRVVQHRLKNHAIKAGLPVHVHPHVLRHSFASHLLQSSGDLRAVQELLGHASITSTQIYTSLDFQHLAAVYDKAHPRAKAK